VPLTVLVLAMLTTVAWASVAEAQAQSPPAGLGEVTGQVARCAGSLEVPAPDANVGVQDGQTDMARSDPAGSFAMALPPGEYTIVASAADGTTALRENVPVSADQTLDIGILDLGASLMGCGGDSSGVQGQSAPVTTPSPTPPPLLPTITPTNGPGAASGG
jgi:hypothetical protein